MSKLADKLVEAGYADHILTERQVASILKGSESRRYGLVNRALKDQIGPLNQLRSRNAVAMQVHIVGHWPRHFRAACR